MPLYILGDSPNFMKGDDMAAVIAGIKAIPTMPGLVIVDTWAQVTPGANENAGEDMGKALAQCKRLHTATGALVLLVHHSGKDASKGARGWSGLNAASDCTIEVIRSDNDRVATITKMKDGEDGAEFGFKLLTVQLSDDVSSCVVEHTVAAPKDKRKRDPRGPREQLVLRCVLDAMGPDNRAEVGDILNAAVDQMPHDPASNKRDRRREIALQALSGLRDAGRIEIADQHVKLCT